MVLSKVRLRSNEFVKYSLMLGKNKKAAEKLGGEKALFEDYV